jgi:hypothetical protein
MSLLATTGGISGDDVRDLMVTAVEHRFGRVNRLPATIEWLSDNRRYRWRYAQIRSLHRSRTENDTHRKSAEQWNG